MPSEDRLLRNASGVARTRSAVDTAALSLEDAIGSNVRQLRQQSGLSISDLADRIGISKAMLSKIENSQTSASLATVAKLARGLDVPVTTLFRGADVERQAAYVAAGTGSVIARNGTQQGHLYELLGSLRGEHRRLECLLVTLNEQSEAHPLFQHPGTEFIYLLEGEMVYGHSTSSYRLRPGDSLQFDGEGAHGPVELTTLPIRFLSVIAFPDGTF